MTSPDQPAGWRRSTYSGQIGNCVEVTAESDGWLVRDSKDPHGPALGLSGPQWATFIHDIQYGRMG